MTNCKLDESLMLRVDAGEFDIEPEYIPMPLGKGSWQKPSKHHPWKKLMLPCSQDEKGKLDEKLYRIAAGSRYKH